MSVQQNETVVVKMFFFAQLNTYSFLDLPNDEKEKIRCLLYGDSGDLVGLREVNTGADTLREWIGLRSIGLDCFVLELTSVSLT